MRMKKTVTHWSLKQRTKTMVRVGCGEPEDDSDEDLLEDPREELGFTVF